MATERAVGRRRQVVVGPLAHHAEPVGELGREEHTRTAEHQAVVARDQRRRLAGGGIRLVIVLDIGDGCLRHDRYRHIVEAFRRKKGLADGVAGQLEIATVRRELGKADVTGNALLPGLSREGRNSLRRADQRQKQQQRERRRQQCASGRSRHCSCTSAIHRSTPSFGLAAQARLGCHLPWGRRKADV